MISWINFFHLVSRCGEIERRAVAPSRAHKMLPCTPKMGFYFANAIPIRFVYLCFIRFWEPNEIILLLKFIRQLPVYLCSSCFHLLLQLVGFTDCFFVLSRCGAASRVCRHKHPVDLILPSSFIFFFLVFSYFSGVKSIFWSDYCFDYCVRMHRTSCQ